MKKWITVALQLFFISYLPTICQFTSFGSTYWLLETGGTYRGLRSQLLKGSTEVDNNVEVLDDPTYVLLLLASILLWIQSMIFMCVGVIVASNRLHGCCARLLSKGVYVAIGMYIIASFLMLAACIRFASLFPMKKLKSAFYINMATFCYIWLIVLVFIFDHIFKRRNDANVCSTLICGLREISENDDNVFI
ncbi:uncharacterized protein LOC132743421 isoform X1 [Ruditapes philippinarum]|uniref:uncharacterized protein LOC132743421 isoform X1 n=1 Tax=Ruditapes philippinarum TaxID=129788 RepID=UPI00295BBDEB|nr:uncharacterized protein LOC132743421 isoform X1 [Ruditapes philippinarum]